MPRPATGSILTLTLADGTRKFRLRFQAFGDRQDLVLHERAGCPCGCGGGWDERSARTELGNVIARVRAGVWKRPTKGLDPGPAEAVPTFHEYASGWLARKIDGVSTDRRLAAATIAHYRTVLIRHLLPYFAERSLDDIDRRICMAFKAYKLREASELREAIDAGAEPRDKRNRRLVPLSACQIRGVIGVLAMVLDEAMEDELIDRNPARGKRMRMRVPKPARSFLELDELAALLDAASAQDAVPALDSKDLKGDDTRARIARRVAAGRRPIDIAAELGLTKATVGFHVARLGAQQSTGYLGRRAVTELLARAGVRASELCDLRWRDVRLHEPSGARFYVRSSKTDAGVREVQMTPDLLQAVIEHRDRLRRAGQPTGQDDFVIPNRRGGRLDRQRVREIVAQARTVANEQRATRGLPSLPHITPHSLRRTYISIALLANNFDVKWVMSQVGHADSKMTLDVYAQLEQRARRDHGRSFDRLIAGARETAVA
ncbi:MAG TPA: site-specific integrase [Solirubrobacteraceae bacterium]|jgi:integrase|nr:site-specific integrase [Solirubrobacteraceae bacterium]